MTVEQLILHNGLKTLRVNSKQQAGLRKVEEKRREHLQMAMLFLNIFGEPSDANMMTVRPARDILLRGFKRES